MALIKKKIRTILRAREIREPTSSYTTFGSYIQDASNPSYGSTVSVSVYSRSESGHYMMKRSVEIHLLMLLVQSECVYIPIGHNVFERSMPLLQLCTYSLSSSSGALTFARGNSEHNICKKRYPHRGHSVDHVFAEHADQFRAYSQSVINVTRAYSTLEIRCSIDQGHVPCRRRSNTRKRPTSVGFCRSSTFAIVE